MASDEGGISGARLLEARKEEAKNNDTISCRPPPKLPANWTEGARFMSQTTSSIVRMPTDTLTHARCQTSA